LNTFASKRAGIERRTGQPFHQLRHSFASGLLAAGVPIFKVSRWLGHASIQLTADAYGHLIPKPDEHDALDALDGSPRPRSATKVPHTVSR
jgi:integrase